MKRRDEFRTFRRRGGGGLAEAEAGAEAGVIFGELT